MIEDRLRRFQGRSLDDGEQIVDADRIEDGLIEQMNALARDARPGRMRLAARTVYHCKNMLPSA